MNRSYGFQMSLRKRRSIGVVAAMIAMMGTMVLLVATPAANAAPAAFGPGNRPLAGTAVIARSPGAAPRSNVEKPAVVGTWTQQNEIAGGNQEGGLGQSIAVSGSTMVVGAPYDNGGIGAAYVYTVSGTNFTQDTELTPLSDGVSGDYFGYAVAIKGGEIVVGAPCHTVSEQQCTGAAYVFTGSGSSWTQQAELDDPGQAYDDFFGLAVGIGSNSVLASAYGEDDNQGAVFAYTLQHAHWAEKDDIADPAATDNDLFGLSMVASGKKLVIGAGGTDGSKGAAYVYNEVRGGWVEKATLVAGNGEGCDTTCGASVGYIYGDDFGYSVALSGRTIVVGAPYASYPIGKPDSVGSGAAYVFTGSGSNWTENTEVADQPEYSANDGSPPNCTFFTSPCVAEDQFGAVVGLLGSTVVAAAPEDSQGYPNSSYGAAFVIPKKGGTWPSSSPLTKLTADFGMVGDSLGSAVATIGHNIIVVGASPATGYNGAVYFFQD